MGNLVALFALCAWTTCGKTNLEYRQREWRQCEESCLRDSLLHLERERELLDSRARAALPSALSETFDSVNRHWLTYRQAECFAFGRGRSAGATIRCQLLAALARIRVLERYDPECGAAGRCETGGEDAVIEVCTADSDASSPLECMRLRGDSAARALEALERAVRDRMDTQARQAFDSATAAWRRYSSMECRLTVLRFTGGTIAPVQGHACRHDLAEQRSGLLNLLRSPPAPR